MEDLDELGKRHLKEFIDGWGADRYNTLTIMNLTNKKTLPTNVSYRIIEVAKKHVIEDLIGRNVPSICRCIIIIGNIAKNTNKKEVKSIAIEALADLTKYDNYANINKQMQKDYDYDRRSGFIEKKFENIKNVVDYFCNLAEDRLQELGVIPEILKEVGEDLDKSFGEQKVNSK